MREWVGEVQKEGDFSLRFESRSRIVVGVIDISIVTRHVICFVCRNFHENSSFYSNHHRALFCRCFG